MKIFVKYFGRFAVELGKFSEELEIPDGIIVKDFLALLREKYPLFKNEEIEVSVDGKYAREEEKIISKEIAVFPPISGG